jgi:prefoldin subunit 5
LHDLQQKNNELRRLQDQLQALRGMQVPCLLELSHYFMRC